MKPYTPRVIALLFGLLVLPLSVPTGGLFSTAYADTSDKPIAVNATIVSNCNFNGSGGGTLSFGTYSPIGNEETTSLNSTMDFDVRCNKGTAVALKLDTGEQASGSTRRMYANGEYLVYELYSDAAYTQVWGESTSNDVDYIATSSAPQSPTIYAKIAPGQDVSIGTYTDTVTITTSF